MHLAALLTGLAVVGQVAATPCPPRPRIKKIELGPRPYFLVNNMTDGPLKEKLESCQEKRMKPSKWSIGHRGGATLQIPEHSKESNLAGARMGAGVLECDVTFTKDRQLVCRHSQCDLHTTTNIVAIPELNRKCRQPFEPAGNGTLARAECCTSDITLSEYKSLCAKMDSFNATAKTATDYLGGTPSWRTDLYASCGTMMDHKEHIALVESLGLQHTPELKVPQVKMPFEDEYTQEMYAKQMIDNYKAAGVPASRVLAQSFRYNDIQLWLKEYPDFGNNSVLLDESGNTPETYPGAVRNLTRYRDEGVRTVAPPMQYLVEAAKDGRMVASEYAREANRLGLRIMTWTLERSGPLATVGARGDFYYTSVRDLVTKDGDMYELLSVLHRDANVAGLFSDWSATTTLYANCFGLGL